MQEKPTAALEQELSACADLRAYLKTNTGALCAPGLPALLQQLMQSRGLSRAELLRRSGLNAVYGLSLIHIFGVRDLESLAAQFAFRRLIGAGQRVGDGVTVFVELIIVCLLYTSRCI